MPHSKKNPKYAPEQHNQTLKCYNCGNPYPHTNDCPARNQSCHICGKRNHFAEVCRSTRISPGQRRPLNQLEQHEVYADTPPIHVNSIDTPLFYLDEANSIQNNYKLKQFKTTLKLNNINVPFLIDNGSSTNIINYDTFHQLCKKDFITPQMTNISFVPFGSDIHNVKIHPAGKITCHIGSKSRYATADFYIDKTKSHNLIGGILATELNFLNLNINSLTTAGIRHDIINAERSQRDVKSLVHRYKSVFYGTGKLSNKKVTLNINSNVTPFAQKPRRISFKLRTKVDEELKRLRQEDIIEDVKEGSTPWVSPIVVVPNKHDPEKIRLCIDMRQANRAIERLRHPMPTADDLIHDLNGSTIFCKIEYELSAFLQRELDEASRHITTFVTHQRLHRFERLNFGTSAASEELQLKIESILYDIEGCKNLQDDIILYAKTRTEMDKILHKTLQRLQENNITLAPSKCEFYKERIEFYGLIFSEKGVSPSPEKVLAIKDISPPTSVHEVRSFLDMANYVSRFITNYTNMTENLRQLKKGYPLGVGKCSSGRI